MEHPIFDNTDSFNGCMIDTSDDEETEYNDENTRNTPVLKISQEPNKYSNKCTLFEFEKINKVSIEEIRDLYNQKNTKENFNKLGLRISYFSKSGCRLQLNPWGQLDDILIF